MASVKTISPGVKAKRAAWIKHADPMRISVDEYLEMQSANEGMCLNCGDIRSMCEPDADWYRCDSCDEYAVQGALNLLMMDLVDE